MNNLEIILQEFVQWCSDNSEDAFDIFDNTDKMIERFLEERDN
jgi:hypothetical protein